MPGAQGLLAAWEDLVMKRAKTSSGTYGSASNSSNSGSVPPASARRLSAKEAEDLRLQNLLATGNEHGATAESAV